MHFPIKEHTKVKLCNFITQNLKLLLTFACLKNIIRLNMVQSQILSHAVAVCNNSAQLCRSADNRPWMTDHIVINI